MASKFPPAKLLAPDRKRQRRPVLQAKLGLCPPPARRFQAPSPVCTLEPGSPSLPSRGQDTGPKAQGQPQPDCPQGAETTGRGNPSSCPSPKSLVAASAQRERASADSGASQEAHTRPISQLEFPSGEPSGTASRPGSGREGVRGGSELHGTWPDLVPRSWTRGEAGPAGQAAPWRAPGAELRFTCPP